jgi:hypothetical protein
VSTAVMAALKYTCFSLTAAWRIRRGGRDAALFALFKIAKCHEAASRRRCTIPPRQIDIEFRYETTIAAEVYDRLAPLAVMLLLMSRIRYKNGVVAKMVVDCRKADQAASMSAFSVLNRLWSAERALPSSINNFLTALSYCGLPWKPRFVAIRSNAGVSRTG